MKIISFLPFLFITLCLFAQKRTEMTIHFDFAKADIRPDDSRLLDSLIATFPLKAKNISIEIYGHCDERGSNGYNDTLSIKRVKAVEKYLLANGVELSFITNEQGYGSQRPLADVRNSNYEIINRRVELIITTTEEKKLTKAFEDTATKAGSKIPLNNLNFVGSSYELLPQSKPVLKELLSIMRKYPVLVIAIEGHICCVQGLNDVPIPGGVSNLSGARAQIVYNYLVQNGVAVNRLSYIGYGHRFPIYPYPEKNEEEKEANRRVEIRIVKK